MTRTHQTSFKKLDPNYVKREISPLDFYRAELANAQLKKHGWNDGDLCLFHPDTKPGSFKVNLQTGAFICFSCSTKGPDIIAFVMHRYGLNFPDALYKLADDWGLYD